MNTRNWYLDYRICQQKNEAVAKEMQNYRMAKEALSGRAGRTGQFNHHLFQMGGLLANLGMAIKKLSAYPAKFLTTS